MSLLTAEEKKNVQEDKSLSKQRQIIHCLYTIKATCKKQQNCKKHLCTWNKKLCNS